MKAWLPGTKRIMCEACYESCRFGAITCEGRVVR